MIVSISWSEILEIWSTKLWPNRASPIESNSAMRYLGEYDGFNMITTATFFGCKLAEKLVGVNSGHMCADNMYRSRGLWVSPEYRGKGIGQQLLQATINQAKKERATLIWSLPRQTSWNTYQAVGFKLSSDWHTSETSEQNAYCVKTLS